ncbi:hypothetical protein [Spirosoma horti]
MMSFLSRLFGGLLFWLLYLAVIICPEAIESIYSSLVSNPNDRYDNE